MEGSISDILSVLSHCRTVLVVSQGYISVRFNVNLNNIFVVFRDGTYMRLNLTTNLRLSRLVMLLIPPHYQQPFPFGYPKMPSALERVA